MRLFTAIPNAITVVVTARATICTGLVLSAVGLFVVERTAQAQTPDSARPPAVLASAGPFSARRLASAPAVDGRQWIAASVQSGYPAPRVAEVPRRRFSLTFVDAATEDTGDVERYRLLFRRARGPAVRIDDAFTAWVYVTPDSRYIITEPLYVLDVDEWTQYALHEALGIPNYTSIDAISRDGKRLLISRVECVFDCPSELPVEYYELTLRR